MDIDNPATTTTTMTTTAAAAAAAAPDSNNFSQQQSTQVLSSMHMDFVHHVAFDMYGRRMGTCSGDRFVRIWDLTQDGDWMLSAEWQAHRSAVSQLEFGHPEFGPLLVTCGSDSDVKVWEERESLNPIASSSSSGSTNQHHAEVSMKRWVQRAGLTEARRAVTCCEFGPRQYGLKIAAGSADGMLRLYEAVDVMNLAQWPLQATLSVFPTATDAIGITCLSWSTGRFEPPTLVVGGTHLVVYRYLKQKWQSILTLGHQRSDGTTSKSAAASTATTTAEASTAPSSNNSNKHHVLDVAWAPNVGRRFHWIAAAQGTELRLYKLLRTSDTNQLELESTQVLQTEATVWRCQWNVTGTVLATSGDGGVVQLWKSDFDGNWKCVSQIHGALTSSPTGSSP